MKRIKLPIPKPSLVVPSVAVVALLGVAVSGGGRGVFGQQSERKMVTLAGVQAAAAPTTVSVVRFSGAGEAGEAGAAGVWDEMEEDLRVMAHILGKRVAPNGVTARSYVQTYRLGIPVSVNSGLKSATYLEGFGALFRLQATIPLLPEAEAGEPATEPAQPDEWATAKRELGTRTLFGGGGTDWVKVQPAGGEKDTHLRYHAGAVQRPKDALVEALSAAANIRHLKDGDYVAVEVNGAPTASPRFGLASRVRFIPNSDQFLVPDAGQRVVPPVRVGVLAVRAKVSDIQATAAGDLSAEDFRAAVEYNLYESP